MSTNRNGSQRNVYLRNDEWEEYDKLSKREGFGIKGTKFLLFLLRQYLCGNLVFKRKND